MQTIKIIYTNGNVEKINNCLLINADNDEATEYQIHTDNGIMHIPLTVVETLLEVE